MNRTWLFALLTLVSAIDARAMDHRSQYGVGGALGANFAAPWGSQDFRSQVGPEFPALSAWARYIPGTPEIGLELSYNYIALSQMNFYAHTAVLSFISRQNPWGWFHPFYGAGFGYAHAVNKFATGPAGVWDDPIVKLTAGIEFELNDRTDVGLRIDHYSIFRDTNAQRDMQILVPMLSLNHYFGVPAAMPTAKPPIPAPVPTTKPSVSQPGPQDEQPPPVKRPKRKRAKKRPPAFRPPPVDYDGN